MESITPFVILPVVYFARSIDFEEGDRLLYLRCVFVAVQIVAWAVRFYVLSRINSTNNKTIIKYKEPAAPFSQETPKEKQCTVQEYDKAEWMKDVKQSVIQLGIFAFIHFKWGYAIPLVTQLVMTPMRLLGSHLVRAHLLGQTVERPFPAPKSPFSALTEQMQEVTGQASTSATKEERAAKKGRAAKAKRELNKKRN